MIINILKDTFFKNFQVIHLINSFPPKKKISSCITQLKNSSTKKDIDFSMINNIQISNLT